jgi:uncharacterized protein with von Willebrand factor type A (vWA) domain
MDNVRFEVTDKGLDFLGYRALRDLLGALGKSQQRGATIPRDVASGIDAGASAEAVRVRRHDESRPERHGTQRRLAGRR